MKIGEFSKANNVSIDAVRYYMDLNLIIPFKKGSQYDFDERCKEQLDEINGLKKMGFTLKEIKNIILFKRFGSINCCEEVDYYKNIFQCKLHSIDKEIKKQEAFKREIENNINKINKREIKKKKKSTFGINVNALSILACSKCGGQLFVENSYVHDNEIIRGKLVCNNCKREYVIEDGILYGNKELIKRYPEESDNIPRINIEDDTYYIEEICSGLQWFNKEKILKHKNIKIILDLGSGIGLGLRYFYNELRDDTIYLAVDYDIKNHKFLKSLFSSGGKHKNIIFICCDFHDIPLKEECIDLLIDGSGSSTYSFNHNGFLLEDIKRLLHKNSKLAGFYLIYDKYNFNNNIENRKSFSIDYIQDNLRKLGINILQEDKGKYLKRKDDDNFLLKNEKAYFYTCYGEKK